MLIDYIKKRILISESRDIDHTLILSFAVLAAIGFVMVTSATLDYSYQKTSNPFFFIFKHSIFLILGLMLASIVSRVRLSFYNDYGKLFLLLSFLLSIIISNP